VAARRKPALDVWWSGRAYYSVAGTTHVVLTILYVWDWCVAADVAEEKGALRVSDAADGI
jgi:hypothetical protein